MSTWRMYTVKVKHDRGVARLSIAAETAEDAKEIIRTVEGCPESAIIGVREGRVVCSY